MDVKEFYDALFPYRPFFQWLNHSPKPGADFAQREFAFTVANGSGSDIYVRYQSFAAVEAFRKKVQLLAPKRFEIGAVYTARPSEHKLVAPEKYAPVSKELVFDIDLSDYDDVRTCCQGKQVCIKCWQLVVAAMDVLGAALHADFGYAHVLWVFSGRRGVHAWVCDARARALDDAQREHLVEYLSVTARREKGRVAVPRPLHPSVQRALQLLARRFDEVVLAGQDPWRAPEGAHALLERLRPLGEPLAAALRAKWGDAPLPSRRRWLDIDAAAQETPGVDAARLLELKQDVVLEYMYPRLDAAVSVSRQHLLKSPFCVHPDTGKVCVPINASTLASFDPDRVPTLQTLAADHALLDPYVGVFKQFVHELVLGENKKRVADTLDF